MNTRIINEDTNPLIIQHRKSRSDDAPSPITFPTYAAFLVAHRNWLRELRVQNRKDMGKLFRLTRDMQGYEPMDKSLLFAYMSKVIHYRKEYDSFLVRGIDACTRHIEGR